MAKAKNKAKSNALRLSIGLLILVAALGTLVGWVDGRTLIILLCLWCVLISVWRTFETLWFLCTGESPESVEQHRATDPAVESAVGRLFVLMARLVGHAALSFGATWALVVILDAYM